MTDKTSQQDEEVIITLEEDQACIHFLDLENFHVILPRDLGERSDMFVLVHAIANIAVNHPEYIQASVNELYPPEPEETKEPSILDFPKGNA